MSDIVADLREAIGPDPRLVKGQTQKVFVRRAMLHDTAAEIERLRAVEQAARQAATCIKECNGGSGRVCEDIAADLDFALASPVVRQDAR